MNVSVKLVESGETITLSLPQEIGDSVKFSFSNSITLIIVNSMKPNTFRFGLGVNGGSVQLLHSSVYSDDKSIDHSFGFRDAHKMDYEIKDGDVLNLYISWLIMPNGEKVNAIDRSGSQRED